MFILSSNITSPLGMTTEANYSAVRAGQTGLSCNEEGRAVPFAFTASLFSDEQWKQITLLGRTRFESLVLHSMRDAIGRLPFVLPRERTVWIISTTKGNIENMEQGGEPASPAVAVEEEYGGDTIVVSNACISGVAAQILAHRLIAAGEYDYAVVTGADVLGRFIISGFESLKALSPQPCRPFDMERLGLNLGEGAATVVFGRDGGIESWALMSGSINNDAYHISSPHPKGDGLAMSINAAMKNAGLSVVTGNNRPSAISGHGTATMYNDQMESKAIEHAGLSDVPLTLLKGYYGHTLGAAGLIETIITARALDDGVVLPTKGFEELGVSGKVNVCAEEQQTEGRSFVKLMSGFGGCNAAAMFAKQPSLPIASHPLPHVSCTNRVSITPSGIAVNGKALDVTATGSAMLTEVYKAHIGSYPKFYKMDMLSRLAFVAAELLTQAETADGDTIDANHRAVVLFNSSSSIVADREYMESIYDEENFFPSPAVFVYTLPNISTGEIALRNGYHGETSFYILRDRNEQMMDAVIRATFLSTEVSSMITGWVNCDDKNEFTADLRILTKQ